MDTLILHTAGSAAGTAIMLTASPPSHRWWIRLGLLVVTVILASTSVQRDPNLYDSIGISPRASEAEIRSRWREQLTVLKQLSPEFLGRELNDAEITWKNHIKKSFQILSQPDKRQHYNTWGDYNEGDVRDDDMMTILLLGLCGDVLCVGIAFLLSSSPELSLCKQLTVLYTIVAFCCELQLRLGGESVLDMTPEWSPAVLTFELVHILRRLYPAVICLAMVISSLMRHDTPQIIEALLLGGMQTTARIGTLMEETAEAIPDATRIAISQRAAKSKQAASAKPLRSTTADFKKKLSNDEEALLSSLSEKDVERLVKLVGELHSNEQKKKDTPWTGVLSWLSWHQIILIAFTALGWYYS